MSDLKAKRLAAGISGSVLCAKIGLSRRRLSLIERGHVCPAPEELARLEAALDELREAGVERAIFMLPPADRDTVMPLVEKYAELIE